MRAVPRILFWLLTYTVPLLAAESPPGSGNRLFMLEYEATDAPEPSQLVSDLELARETIKARLRARGLNALVGRVNQQVWVRVTNSDPNLVNAVRHELKNRSHVEFRLVHPNQGVPGKFDPIPFKSSFRGRTFEELLWIKRGSELGNREIKSSYPILTDKDRYEVIVELTESGRSRFAALTRRIAEASSQDGSTHRVAIMLDGVVLAAPAVRQAIDTDRITISGQFGDREALELANLLSAPLVLPPIREERTQ